MGILYLVKVGETQRMGEFVAECADAGDIVGETAQLVGACIVAQSHAVVHYTAAYLSRMCHTHVLSPVSAWLKPA